MTSLGKEMGGGLEMCHVFADFIVSKEYIYCSFSADEGRRSIVYF